MAPSNSSGPRASRSWKRLRSLEVPVDIATAYPPTVRGASGALGEAEG